MYEFATVLVHDLRCSVDAVFSDRLVDSVLPRSGTGAGDDLSKKPAEALAAIPAATGSIHDAAVPTTGRPTRSNPRVVAVPPPSGCSAPCRSCS